MDRRTCLIVYDAFGVLAFYELYTLEAEPGRSQTWNDLIYSTISGESFNGAVPLLDI